MRPLKAAVIGAGQIAQAYHLPSLVRLASQGRIELTAICDIVPGRAEAMALRFGFEHAFDDYRIMLDTVAPDAVWVLVPMEAMRAIAGYTLAAGLPTMMEKPPGRNSAETRDLLELAARHGTPHQVAFNRRYAPLLVKMKELLAESGPLTGLSCQFCRVGRTESYFGFGTGLHGLDTIRFLADAEVSRLVTRTGPRQSAWVALDFESGARASFEMLPQAGLQSERYTAHAGERTVIVDGVIGWLTHFPGFLACYDGGQLVLEEQSDSSLPPEVISGFYGESAAFVDTLRQGVDPAPNLAVAMRSVEAAAAVAEAIADAASAGPRAQFAPATGRKGNR